MILATGLASRLDACSLIGSCPDADHITCLPVGSYGLFTGRLSRTDAGHIYCLPAVSGLDAGHVNFVPVGSSLNTGHVTDNWYVPVLMLATWLVYW